MFLAWGFAALLLSQDAGVASKPVGFASLRGATVRLEVVDGRSREERDPPTDRIEAAIAKGLDAAQIRVGPDGTKILRVQIQRGEKRVGENTTLYCAQVRGLIRDKEKEFLPSPEVESSRCVNENAKADQDASNPFGPVPKAVVQALESGGAKSQAYGIALAEVLTTLERRIR
jgi:hypothetical protein